MGFLSNLGKKLKGAFQRQVARAEARARPTRVLKGTLPIGAGIAGLGKGFLGFFKALPSVGKAIKGLLTATLATGAIAGGGALVIPKLFKGAKKGAQILTGDEPITKAQIPDVLKAAGLGGLAGLLGAGALLLPAALGQPEGFQTLPQAINGLPAAGAQQVLPTEAGTTQKPVTPETQIINGEPVKKPRKRATQARRTTIKQEVNVRVGVRGDSRKFIKNVVFN